MKIITYYDPPPVPFRHSDWVAITDNYDADWQGEEDGYVSHSPIGHGATEAEALADLMEQIDDAD